MRIAQPSLVACAFTTAFMLLGAALAPLAAQQAPAFKDESKIPDTPACKRALEVVDLINKGDHEKVRAYILEYFMPEYRDMAPMEEHLQVFDGIREESEGYDVHSVRVYDPPRPATNATIILRNHLTDSWEAIVLDVEEAAPYRIASLRFAPARTPSDMPPEKKLTDAEIAKQLDAYIDKLAAKDRFSGTALLAKDGKVFYTKAVGIANRDFMAPNKLDTKFNTGSMFKMLTAVAVAQLADAGKLSFDDKIGKYLGADWLVQPILDTVTIEQLLTHTSGLGSYFNETYDRSSRLLFRKVEDYKPLVIGDTLAFEPGSRWQYSNTGFLLLGAIVEKASGEDYFDYVRAHVTGPAGMKNTDCYELDLVNPNLAVGYDKERGPNGTIYRNNIFQHVLRGGPAGGGYTTVEDMLAFDAALRSGKLVSKEMLEKMWSPKNNSPTYGYGFGVYNSPIGRAVGHAGGFAGISAEFMMFLDAGYTWCVLSNYGNGASPVSNKVSNLIGRR
ncbi:MAG: class A beta-lactamase-related serine hydrolase [Candidatus Latescibacterota bacterium]|nr:MAG: class A beta-lactamase-related serine hydrolase [Candidatus Latescibacterota bacterium]